MDYEMEELVPVVGKLAEKYTAFESTSVSYEKAEQLMEAVLYCIHEAALYGQGSLASPEGMSAWQAYETGAKLAAEKVEKALELYNTILPEFAFFKNRCLYDTFIKELPEFFKWYDVKFAPQNTILTLDYPVLKDLSGDTGIDRIFEYINCIRLEQSFLRRFPEDYVINILSRHDSLYEDMTDNICEIVFTSVIGHILAEKPLSGQDFGEADDRLVQEKYLKGDLQDINHHLKRAAEGFLREYYGNGEELWEYLAGSVGGLAVRMKNAGAHGALFKLF